MSDDADIFADALDLPAAKREAFLIAQCGGDAARIERVKVLLRAHEKAEYTLVAPLVSRPTMVETQAGTIIGNYKLLEKIGEGGCGVVWMAQQEEPVRRRVALKEIKLGMDTKEVIARFEAERQALAMMEHPNIARVLEAGATAEGRPYFVMELVRGKPITTYCDERNLSTRQRLALFARVCRALHHAHEKGIVHRDIKPSNILVTQEDGEPLPKVIDFGVAKATQGRLTDRTLFTAFEQFIGTPAYMSPEQADYHAHEVDARSDVYSLGALLYELISGHPPFDPRLLNTHGIDEVRRIIREVAPPWPSTRFHNLTAADQTTLAQRRGTAPALHAVQLRDDLDWIAMKALDKNRARRYKSAADLAADVERYQAGEPVQARPPSPTYVAVKFVQRHKVAVISVAVGLLALEAGTAVSLWQSHRAMRAEAEQVRLRSAHATAVAAADRSTEQAELDQANELLTPLRENFFGEVAPGEREDRVAVRVARALAAFDRVSLAQRSGQWARDRALVELRGALADRRMIARDYARRAELARAGIEQLRENGDTSAEASLLLALAQVVRYDPVAPVFLYGNDRNNPQRLAALRQAEALLRPLALAENGAARYRVHLAEVLYTEGQRYTGPNGRKPLAEALALLDGLDAAIRATPAVQLARAKILSLVGVRSSAEESERYQRETLRVAEEFLARQTGSIAALRLQLDVHLERVRRHRHTPAEMDAWDAAFRLGAEINRRDPSSDDNWYACLNAGRERGYAYLHRGRIAEALASLHAVAEEGNYPLRVGVVPPVRGRRYLPGIFERIAYWEAARGNTALADQALQAAYRHPPGLDVGAGGTDLAVLFRDPILIWRLRRTALLFAGDFAGAIANGESNWTQLKILLQRPDATEPDRIAFLREVESVQEQLAEAHLSLGSYAAAEAALATPPGLKPAKAPAFTPAMRVWLALALTRQGRDEEARSALEPVLQGARERLNRGTVIFTDQEILARAYFVAALAQPATEAGRARRSSALAECERILAGMPAEARELYYQRLLRRWIAEERARLPG